MIRYLLLLTLFLLFLWGGATFEAMTYLNHRADGRALEWRPFATASYISAAFFGILMLVKSASTQTPNGKQ